MVQLLKRRSTGSSLSPPTENMKTTLGQGAEAGLSVKATVLNGAGQKRKAETTAMAMKRARKATVDDEDKDTIEINGVDGTAENSKRKPRAAKVRAREELVKDEVEVDAEENDDGHPEFKTVKRKRQTKRKEASLAPLEERTVGSKICVGAHVSIAGGVHNSITNSLFIGANAIAFFLKSQRKWDNPALNPDHATLFIDDCKKHGIEPGSCCVPHGSYLVNLAHPDKARKKQAYDSFHDDLTRCYKLGIKYYNFHPGNANATTREEGIRLIAEHINTAHKDPATGDVIPLLETMASLGNTIGGTFEDIAAIIEHVEDKDRIGVCLDTCHAFAAGYDLRTPEIYLETIATFDKVIGLRYLKALHINDSKAPFASHRDLHARIGTGYLGLRAFYNVVNDERLHGLPMVLETPIDVIGEDGKKTEDKGIWAREIKMLEKLVGMDVKSEEFKELEADLQYQGKEERERIGEQVERKKAKVDRGVKKKGKKKVESEDDDDNDEE